MALQEKWLTADLQFPIHLNVKSASMSEARYIYASHFVYGKIVLDIGCGLGDGSWAMSKRANAVIGVDISKDALIYARNKYREENLHFICASASCLPFRSKNFEVILGFEIVEHVESYMEFLCECNRVASINNRFIMSTPNKLVTSPYWKKPLNPAHIQEFTPDQILSLVSRYFVINQIKGQQAKNKSAIVRDCVFALIGNLLNIINLKKVKKIYRLSAGRSTKGMRKSDYSVSTFSDNCSNIVILSTKSTAKD